MDVLQLNTSLHGWSAFQGYDLLHPTDAGRAKIYKLKPYNIYKATITATVILMAKWQMRPVLGLVNLKAVLRTRYR